MMAWIVYSPVHPEANLQEERGVGEGTQKRSRMVEYEAGEANSDIDSVTTSRHASYTHDVTHRWLWYPVPPFRLEMPVSVRRM